MPQENHNAPQSLPSEDDVVSLMDIINFLQNGWKVIVIASILGLGIGGSYAFFTPSKFQAEVLVQGALIAGVAVEQPQALVEKLKQPTYFSPTTLSSCDTVAASAISGELKTTIYKNSNSNLPSLNLLKLSYTSNSPSKAKACLEAVVIDIQNHQALLPKPLMAIREERLAESRQQLDLLEKITLELNKSYVEKESNAAAIVQSVILSRQKEISDLRKSIELQTVELSPPQTQSAVMATPIYAPGAPVYPKKLPVIAGGLFGGALFGILWLLARQSWQKIKPQLRQHSI